MKTLFAFPLVSLFLGATALAGASITYHGRILDPDQKPVEATGVTFKVQVRSPGTANCLLYEETRGVNMAGSEGIFVIPIGDGAGVRTANDPGVLIEKVFSNDVSLNLTGLTCNSGTNYQPSALDSRKLLVSFNDGSGSGDQILPPMDVNYVPFSLYAQEASRALRVGGIDAARVLSVASGSATPLSAANFAELLSLLNGSSSLYVKASSLPNCVSGEVLKSSGGVLSCVTDTSGVATELDPSVQAYAKNVPGTGLKVSASTLTVDFGTGAGKVVQGDDARLSDSRAPSGAATGDLGGSYPNPSVNAIRGFAVAATTPAEGQGFKWNGTSSRWEPKHFGLSDLHKADGTAQMPVTCGAVQVLAWSSATDTLSCVDASDTTRVSKAGDTMTGALILPADGLAVGTDQFVVVNGKIGSGTATPSSTVDIQRADTSTILQVENTGSSASRYPGFNAINYLGPGSTTSGTPKLTLYQAGGTLASPEALPTNKLLGLIEFYGSYGGGQYNYLRGASIAARSEEGFTSGTAGTSLRFATTQPGSTSDVERMRIAPNGNVGIGTASPAAKLTVAGAAINAGSVANATTTIDFSTGNLQHTSNDCGAFDLHNLKDGGSYVLGVKGATAATCSFNAYSDAGTTAITVHMPLDHGPTTASKHTLYNFLVLGSDVYVSWSTGL